MNVIVPMAGRGSRYSDKGYELPKPLIPIQGKPMLYWALKTLKGLDYSKIVFVILQEHEHQYKISSILAQLIENPMIQSIREVTEGQLCTVLEAKEFFDSEEPVLIISADTWVMGNLSHDIINCGHCNGIISVAEMPGDHWSFAKTDHQGKVLDVAEKKRISNWASTGLYFFRSGKQLIEYGQNMIQNKQKTLNEYYVIPVYKNMILDGHDIRISIAETMWDMGTPTAKQEFELYLKSLE